MQIDTAKIAGALAIEITELTRLIAALQDGIQKNWAFAGNISIDTDTQSAAAFTFPKMTAAESQLVFTSAIAVYQARLDALNAQLAAL